MESDLCTLVFRLLLLVWSGAYYLASAASSGARSPELQQRLQKLEAVADRLQQLEVSNTEAIICKTMPFLL